MGADATIPALAVLLHLDQPLWLLAAPVAAVPILIALRARRRGRTVAAGALALQCIAVGLAVLALARPLAPLGPKAFQPWLVLQDVSASVRGQTDRPLEWQAGLPRVDYEFAENLAPRASPGAVQATTGAQPAGPSATCISAPLRLAATRAPQLAGAVLATDGQWQDDWLAAACALAQSGLPIQIVPMDSPPPDARVAALQCRRLPDASVAIQVTAASNAPLRRRLTVRRKGLQAPLLDRDLLLVPETPATARLADSPPGDRVEVYTACLAPGDDFTENDELSAAVLPLAQRFAIIGPADASAFLTAIGAVLQPAEVLDPGAAPSGAAGWVPYSAVVLVDGRGTLLSAPARAALGQYVRDGGGLVLLGCGPCDSPADRHDGLNTVAALLADPYQRQPLRLVVVLDASGSMRERTGPNGLGPRKFDLAQEAVLSLQRHLTANDSLAVVKYADTAALIYDSGARPPDFHVLGDALSAVEPTGQTKVIPALKLAVSSAAPEGKVGLVLLVSDLLTEKLEADKMPEVDKVERDFKDGHWRLSIVATKGANDVNEGKTLLDELARAARLDAQLVRREGLSALAEVFERFIRQGRGQAVARGDFQVTFQKALPLRQTVQWPRIDAYIPSAPQEGAEVLASVGSDAVLALRQVGLGRSAGLALPLSPPDNRLLAQSAPLLEVLTALRQWVQRPGDDPRFTGRLRRQAGRIDLTVEARDQNGPMNHLVLAAVCSAEPSSPLPPRGLSLEQIAPGVYRARIPAAGGLVSLAVRDDQGRIVWREALNDPYAPEYAAIGANWENLRRLADLTGGRIIRRQDLPDLGRRLAAQGLSPLWPWLLAGALLLMLADWCATRILRKR